MEKSKKKIKLKALTSCTSEQQLKVRDIRNQIGVRSNMFTDHEIGLNEHLNWISKLKSEKKQMVFAVLNSQQNPIGTVSISMLDTFHKKADWALYLDGNEKTLNDQKIISSGPSQLDPVNMGKMKMYKDVNIWRSIFDEEDVKIIHDYSNDCSQADIAISKMR